MPSCLSSGMAIFLWKVGNTILMSTEGSAHWEMTVGFVFV